MNKELKISDLPREDQILQQMTPTVQKFAERLRSALRDRETGVFRLHVRLERGVVKQFTNETGENVMIDDVDSPEASV